MTRHERCYECGLARDGRKCTEGHHPFGRSNPAVSEIVVEIPGNWHVCLTAVAADAPKF